MNINDILIHLGEERDKYFNAVSPPIMQTSNFVFDDIDQFRDKIQDELSNHIYTRGNNPTVKILRKKIAALENAEDCLVTSSGAAAMALSLLNNVSAGDHVICVQKPYSWTYHLISQWLTKFGVEYDFVDGREIKNIASSLKPNTRVLFLESPNSFTFELQDLRACASLCKKHNIISIIDNSYSSPAFQKPLDMGIDIVCHSGTKYLNGHSDVVMGVVCSSHEHIRNMFANEFMTLGLNISPSDAALAIRGLRTFDIRMQRIQASTHTIAQFLESHPRIQKVIYPFLPSFPQYQLAKEQMLGCPGLLTIVLKTDLKEDVKKFSQALDKFLIAVSWGGYESLQMPALAFHDIPGKKDSTIPWNYIRLYIGLEDEQFLLKNLSSALDALG